MNLMLKQRVNYFIMSAASRNSERVNAKQITNWRICAASDKAGNKSRKKSPTKSGQSLECQSFK